MGIVAWLKGLWKNKEYEFVCPKCGSKDLGYSSVIINFVEVIREQEDPKYEDTHICNNCKYTSHSLKEFKKVKSE